MENEILKSQIVYLEEVFNKRKNLVKHSNTKTPYRYKQARINNKPNRIQGRIQF